MFRKNLFNTEGKTNGLFDYIADVAFAELGTRVRVDKRVLCTIVVNFVEKSQHCYSVAPTSSYIINNSFYF